MGMWFEETVIGRYVADKEKDFFQKHVAEHDTGRVVQIGQNWLRPSESVIYVPDDVRMEADAMAWEQQSLDMLLLPHTHEFGSRPAAVLAEAARVLKPHGRLAVTGFNLHSLWRTSRWFDGTVLPKKENCLTLPQFKRQVRLLGFEIEYGRFMVYVPPSDNEPALRFWRFLEQAGDRWWPQCAAVYGLVLVKRVAGIMPLPELEDVLEEQPVALGMARLRRE